MKNYHVRNGDNGEFLLTAPLKVVASIFGLHNEAMARIYRETKGNGVCVLWRNNSRWFVECESIQVFRSEF